jgi:hypothetical protein
MFISSPDVAFGRPINGHQIVNSRIKKKQNDAEYFSLTNGFTGASAPIELLIGAA